MNLDKFKGFYARSSIFTILSLIAAVLSYGLYPLLSRALTTEQFGDFAALTAISNQVLGVLLAINIVSIYLVKRYSEEEAREHSQSIQKVLIWFFSLLTMLILLSSPLLNSLLKIDNIILFAILGVVLLVAVPSVVWSGYAQGHKEMIRIGLLNVGSAAFKIVFASILALSFGTLGALLGVLIGVVAGLIIFRIYPGVTPPSISSIFNKFTRKEKRFLLSIKKYFIQCIFIVGTVSLLQNFDITLAKILFSPEVAGTYSGISILSNALYYFSFILIWIILPEIKINDSNNNIRLLKTSFKLLGVLAVSTIVFEILFSKLIINLLLGSAFIGQSNLLIYATLYQITLVSLTLYMYYLLVIRSPRAAVLGSLVLILCVCLPLLLATTPLQMIQLLWFALLIAFTLYLIVIKVSTLYGKNKKKFN